jgi:hypothetical protein
MFLPAWEFVADTHLMKLQRLKNKALLITGKFSMAHNSSRIAQGFQNTAHV